LDLVELYKCRFPIFHQPHLCKNQQHHDENNPHQQHHRNIRSQIRIPSATNLFYGRLRHRPPNQFFFSRGSKIKFALSKVYQQSNPRVLVDTDYFLGTHRRPFQRSQHRHFLQQGCHRVLCVIQGFRKFHCSFPIRPKNHVQLSDMGHFLGSYQKHFRHNQLRHIEVQGYHKVVLYFHPHRKMCCKGPIGQTYHLLEDRRELCTHRLPSVHQAHFCKHPPFHDE